MASRWLRVRRGARTRRLVLGMVLSAVLAGTFGRALGLRGHTTLEEITAAQQAAEATGSELSREINRALLELWRMEDVEYQRNRR